MTCPTCKETAHAHALRTDAQALLDLPPVSNPWKSDGTYNEHGGEYLTHWRCTRSNRVCRAPDGTRGETLRAYMRGTCLWCRAHCAWEGRE